MLCPEANVKMGQGSHPMGTDRSDQPASPLTARTVTVVVLSLGVAVVLGDAGVVTLALPEILRDFGAQVWGVAWVLIAFNLVLALVAVPAARLCVRGDPAVATASWRHWLRGGDDGVCRGTVAGRADRGAGSAGGGRRAGDRGKPRAARCGHWGRARGRAAVGRWPVSPGRRSVR